MNNNKKLNIFIVAGEPSGDLHGSYLIRKLKEINEKQYHYDLNFWGIGGHKMEQENFKSIVPIEKISVVGFVEVVKHLQFFLKLKKKCEKIMIENKIDCFIPIDYPGFNIKLSKFASSIKIPVYYYIAPQFWAWGKNRWKKIKNIAEELLVVFPFEEKYFNDKNIKAKFVGHPLLDNPIFTIIDENLNKENRDKNLVAFFPGSRKQEVLNNIKLYVKTAKQLASINPNLSFAFALSSNIEQKLFEDEISNQINYKIYNNSYELMTTANIGIIKAGTSTLEAALANMNMIVAHITSKSHYLVGKKLINMDYISLPNILMNKPIVKEYIQADANPSKLADAIIELLNNEQLLKIQKNEFRELRKILGNTGSAENVANIILESQKEK